ncbi:type II secretion system protein GspM [Sedimenticola hydrogenitrophicus]|uniref:type II secretion system protein GspM n=1 Tax=Sedimenticola hydrogenitrophicus TaxID=2967975 RepID=UPI0023AE6C2C|nr:type II secretion system protein GspM [Sedimenticola hydrogenitrophicus]
MRAWFYSLAERERFIVSFGLLVLLLIIVYLLIIEPANRSVDQAFHKVNAIETDVVRLQQIIGKYNELDEFKNTPSQEIGRSLLSLIDQSSESSGIKTAIKRLMPEGDAKVRVHLENAEFNRLISWLISNYQQQGISTEALNIRVTDEPGTISGTVLLVR